MRFSEFSESKVTEYAFPKKELPSLNSKGVRVGFEFEYAKKQPDSGSRKVEVPFKDFNNAGITQLFVPRNNKEFLQHYPKIIKKHGINTRKKNAALQLMIEILNEEPKLIPQAISLGFIGIYNHYKRYVKITDKGAIVSDLDLIDYNYLDTSRSGFEEEAKAVSNVIGTKVDPYDNPKMWSIHEDGSINAPGNSIPIELVSPPLPLKQALDDMHKVFAYIRKNAITNNSTGFHVNISLDSARMKSMDLFKFILLLDAPKALAKFKRLRNEYSSPFKFKDMLDNTMYSVTDKFYSYKDYEHSLKNMSPEEMKEKLIDSVITTLNKDIRSEARSGYDDWHYNAVDLGKISRGYLEIRIPGGKDYQNKGNVLQNFILQWTKLMMVASDPRALREKYRDMLWSQLYPIIPRDMKNHLRSVR